MHPTVRPQDSQVTLRDGRKLGYAEYGDAAGFPVIYFHGGLSCRIDATSATQAATAAGVRVIAPDRPGIGLSDRHKGAHLRDWPTDVGELADQLELDDFAVMGWSFGGAYSAACGFAFPARVTDTVLIASGIPRDWPGMIEEINDMDRRFLNWYSRAAALDRLALDAMRIAAETAPKAFVRQAVADFSPQSRAAIERDPDEFTQATIQGLANSGGALDDYGIWNQPWGFDVADVQTPVHIWHGTADELCPPQWARRLHEAIPGSQLTLVADAGHFVARDNWAQIFDALRREPASGRDPRPGH